MMNKIISFCLFMLLCVAIKAEDGHDLWLRSKDPKPVKVNCPKTSDILNVAIQELQDNWQGRPDANFTIILRQEKGIKGDGFRISPNSVHANTEIGILYGVYEILRRQMMGLLSFPDETSSPSYERRILNHWDNIDGSIERGYAGYSIFWRNTNSLKTTALDKRLWREYARANASIGINGAVLNNVNASPLMLTKDYLERTKAIADALRPYGIKVYLSVKFSSPSQLDSLSTSDPLDPAVIKWWNDKAKEIYGLIPDFGGFLVKANSEGQPGPQDYGRTHAEGANMIADAVKPFGGIVMWRAFVYSHNETDRAKQAYSEFMPLDGQFRENVILQVKNGPIDFQPREPFSPLFGAMKKTSVMPEVQITQEYLGQSVHLVCLAPMWEEFLQSETYINGNPCTIAKCTDGSAIPQKYTAIAGVSNIGNDRNWCGHPFAQANWYAFGRLAWKNTITSEKILDEWLRLTFNNSNESISSTSAAWNSLFISPVKELMLESREAAVNYMMPMGLHHLFAAEHHYGPQPWWEPRTVRKDWTPPYYHQADSIGIGFDRTKTGSDALSQYPEAIAGKFNDLKTCPDIYLLWFHHISWNHKLKNGKTLWDELCYTYDKGVQQVRQFQKIWDKTKPYIDIDRFTEVQQKLREQCINAQLWKDACLQYFQKFSNQEIPYDIERPIHNLDDIINEVNQKK